MLGIDGKAARWAWTVFLVALLLFLVYWVRHTLILFTIALFFAYMIGPLVDFIYERTPPWLSRTAALAIVYLLLAGFLATAGTWIISRIAEEAAALVGRWPELVQKAQDFSSRPAPEWLEPIRARALEMLRSQFAGSDRTVEILKATGAKIWAGVGNLIYILLIPLLGFYFVKDGKYFRRTLLAQFANSGRRKFFAGVLGDVNLLLGQYMRALLVLSILTFIFYSIYFAITGVPYALLLAGIASVLEFIPFLGPLLGVITVLTVAAFSGYDHLIWIVIFVLAYQVFQNYVIQPLVMSSGVEIHPLLVLFGAMAGEQIGGLAGVFLSIPVIAILRILLVRINKAREREEIPEAEIPESEVLAPSGPEELDGPHGSA